MSIFLVSGLWLLIAVTPLGDRLEASLPGHLLIEIPLLVLIGLVVGNRLKPRCSRPLAGINWNGIPGILLAGFTLALWMIPRWLDASLDDPLIAGIKYVSLPLLAGLPLVFSWNELPPIARGVVKIEFLAMLFRLGWLYLVSPERLCNNYLLSEQQALGQALIMIGFALGITWLLQVFFTPAGYTPGRNATKPRPF